MSITLPQCFSRRLACRAVAIVLSLWLLPSEARSQDETIDNLLQQATIASQRGEHDRAIAKYGETIARDPKTAKAYYLRGREHFRAGHIEESLADFDKYIELDPRANNRLWERGITDYYAGKYADGAKQFEDYQKFHDQDVENSV